MSQADIHIAGETASAASVNVISAAPAYAVPQSCLALGASGSYPDNTVANLGANGILGVENLPQDCGNNCIAAASGVPQYFTCPSGDCAIASVPLASQLWNPVALFSKDNNGVLFSLPSVPALGAASATGSLIFGIGTQSNNALGSAQIYATDSAAYFTTTYNGVEYPYSYIDSGSNALYFLDSTTLGGIDSAASTPAFTALDRPSVSPSPTPAPMASRGRSLSSIANAVNLLNTGNAAFSNLGGDSGTDTASDYFAFGLPFFSNT